MEKIIKYYNENQDGHKIQLHISDEYNINLDKRENGCIGGNKTIGFYEWLWNKKYKVFKTFSKNDSHYHQMQLDIVMIINCSDNPEEEIIKYLEERE